MKDQTRPSGPRHVQPLNTRSDQRSTAHKNNREELRKLAGQELEQATKALPPTPVQTEPAAKPKTGHRHEYGDRCPEPGPNQRMPGTYPRQRELDSGMTYRPPRSYDGQQDARAYEQPFTGVQNPYGNNFQRLPQVTNPPSSAREYEKGGDRFDSGSWEHLSREAMHKEWRKPTPWPLPVRNRKKIAEDTTSVERRQAPGMCVRSFQFVSGHITGSLRNNFNL